MALTGAPRSSLEVSDGVLRVRGECAWFHLRCQMHANATVAADTEVVMVTSAGAITVRGTTAGVDLRTSAGAVGADQVSGPVRLESSAGAISGTLDSGDVAARTSAGSITLTSRVQRLSAVTSAGSVTLTVPDDIYRVDATTSAGRVDVQVRTDPASTQQITARSSQRGKHHHPAAPITPHSSAVHGRSGQTHMPRPRRSSTDCWATSWSRWMPAWAMPGRISWLAAAGPRVCLA